MSKVRQKRPAARDDAVAMGIRTGENDCPVIVVGIGASAGGLKSLRRLFAKMPSGHGAAFVLIQHLDPSQENLTPKLLRDQTALGVVEATDGMPVLADRIHVIPPDKFLSIAGSRLTLQEPVYCNGLRMPIDHFFCSLAADQGGRGCGIVLSGAGSDGTLGLSEIRAAGGRTLAEEPGSAEFPNMPQSAIHAGVADAVLGAEAMAQTVVTLADQIRKETLNEPKESPEFDADLRAVLEIVRVRVGHDFRCYKPNTLVRRIRRRMTLAKVGTYGDYARFLGEHPEEVGLLQKDLLIGVTEFFRQPQAWEVLEEKVVVPLVERAEPGGEIRVWVPGCSTGKEAYSLAMALAEGVEKAGKKLAVQIFATDSDVASLATARNGSYSKEEMGENISAGRLKRFFTRRDGRYQVVKELREQVVFAPQNITADPPFSRLDLISCRNLLIYLDQEAQRKIIALFHFALREGGFLFLGTAETVGDREDLFEVASKKWRIYRRIGVGRAVGVEIPAYSSEEPRPAPGKVPAAAAWGELGRIPAPRLSLTSAAQQMLLDRFTPACVMIDRKLQVLYVHGSVEDYLTFPRGELTTRVVDMAREGLRARLRGAIDRCLEINRSVSVTARVRRGPAGPAAGGEKSVPVKATVSPLRYPRETDGLLLITFEDYRVSTVKSRGKAMGESDLHQLEDELKVTREELQSTIEQLESSNDQFKASNEEVTAANEELQAANEEMETSKEELQSLNEELNTINTRLEEKVEELEDTNNDVVNLLSSTNIATVFLDKELKVKRYTPASTRLFSLIPSDVGRPMGDVLRRFSDETLLDDGRRVLADLTPLSREVQVEDGRWYIRRITPYRTQDDRIEGVVVTFLDVSDLKETEEALRRSEARFKLLSESADRLLATDIPQGIIKELCRNVMVHLDCQFFFNYLADERAGRLHLNGYAGIHEEEARKIEWLDYGMAISGCVAREGRGIVVEDIQNSSNPQAELVKAYGMLAYACYPLMVQERAIGTLSFATKTRPHFSLQDLAVMKTVVNQIAIAMERMRLIGQLQGTRNELEQRVEGRTAELGEANESLRHLSSKLLSAQEDERRRVAIEIHDTLGASLSAVKFRVEGAMQEMGVEANAASAALKTLVPVIQESIDECRRIQMDLRPPMLDDLGLLATLSWFCRQFKAIYSKIRVEQEIEVEEDDVPRSLRIVAFRVAQEAMNNVAKHSKADLVRLSLRKKDDRMELVLHDNGQGFNPEKALALESTNRGLGLSSMRERTELSGGSFHIESAEGKGTTIRASWPLREKV